MRHVLIAAAALAVSGFVASTAANAQVIYQAGGPDRVGNMCKVATDTRGDEFLRLLRAVRPAGCCERPAPQALSAATERTGGRSPHVAACPVTPGHGQRFLVGPVAGFVT